MNADQCRCGKPRRPGQSYCWDCHAAYMRRFRATHFMPPGQRQRSNARAYTRTYLERGKLERKPCEVCGEPETERHHDDYTKPLKVHWLCRYHHLARHGKILQKSV